VLVWWNGNAQTLAQTQTITLTAVALNAVYTAQISNKTISYTASGTDTTSTAASAWQQLLSANNAPPEFAEIVFTASSNTITATARSAGTPFTLTATAASGGTITQATPQPNSSPADVNNANNYLRGGVGGSVGLPQNGDDLILANSAVPLLWNLDKLASVRLNSLTRWQSFTGTVGLTENNPNGYYEYRPTYFQFSGPQFGILAVTLGQGHVGGGPSRERYNVGGQQTNFAALAAGSAADDYAIRFLGTHALNTLRIAGTSVGVAMLQGESASLATALVDGGGSLALGPGLSFTGTSSVAGPSSVGAAAPGVVTALNASLILWCCPGSVILDQAAQALLQANGSTYPSLLAQGGAVITSLSSSTITSLVLTQAATFDKSSDVQPQTIIGGQVDGDCQILDPNNALSYQTAIAVNGSMQAGAFHFGRGRKVLVS
jgi:hypothetical protein